tara:strand:- start:30 stop:686 length:657 start_codon:yes stop_codon:yes gene_type:complete
MGCEVRDVPNYMVAPQINHMAFSKAQESQGIMYSPEFNPTMVDRDKVDGGIIKLAHGNGRTLLLPPEGTIPRGFQPLHYPVNEAVAKKMGKVDDKGKADLVAVATAQALKAGDELVNPFKPDDETMTRGKEVFNTFCAPCHGKTGAGDGLVAKRGVGMPGYPLTTKGAKPHDYKDGHIFHIISYGRGNMGSYASQINAADRWKAILWLRKLQSTQGAK